MEENDTRITGHVYEGMWEKHGEPLLQRWIWTVSDVKAIFIFGAFGLLLTFSQSQCWVLIRYIVFSRKKAVRMDSNEPDPIQHISQAQAILPFIAYRVKILLRRNYNPRTHLVLPSTTRDSPVISPLFGLLAAFNLGVFVVMSVAIPLQLSEGTLGKALVKSRATDACSTFSRMNIEIEQSNLMDFQKDQRIRTDAIFLQYLRRNEGCGNEYLLQRPQITKGRVESCKFPPNICYIGTKPFEITHWNITGRELGLNLKSKIMLNHRLTCAPIYLDTFLHINESGNTTHLSIAQEAIAREKDRDLYTLHLQTLNGPNSLSADPSGFHGHGEHSGQFSVLPRLQIASVGSWNYLPLDDTRVEIRRNDGVSFLTMYFAGRAAYQSTIEDPLFAAHSKPTDFRPPLNGLVGSQLYFPDHEATALGCVEQFQYHTPRYDFSTPWGLLSEQLFEIKRAVEKTKESKESEDLLELEIIPNALSIHEFLRKGDRSARAHLTQGWWIKQAVSKEQWVTEVETWFMKAIVQAVLYTQSGVRFKIPHMRFNEGGYTGQTNIPAYSFCDRILFWDENYTNISWVGSWMTTVLLSLVCITSFAIKWLDATTRILFVFLVVMVNHLLEKSVFVVGLLGGCSWHLFTSLKSVQSMGFSQGRNAAKTDVRRTPDDFLPLGGRTQEQPGI